MLVLASCSKKNVSTLENVKILDEKSDSEIAVDNEYADTENKESDSLVNFYFTHDSAKIGEDFIITLNVESTDTAFVDGLLSYNLQYDNSLAEFIGFESYGELVTSSLTGNYSIMEGIVNLGYSPAIVANGVICDLHFQIKDDIPVYTDFTVSMQASASKDRTPIGNVTEPSCTVILKG